MRISDWSSCVCSSDRLGWPDGAEKESFGASAVDTRPSTSLGMNGSPLARYYPNSVLVTGFDILFFWDARMMMQGIHFMGDAPFKAVYCPGLVHDAKGQQMSQSKTRKSAVEGKSE